MTALLLASATACTIQKDLATASDSESAAADTTANTTLDGPTTGGLDSDSTDGTTAVTGSSDTTGGSGSTAVSTEVLETGVVEGDNTVIEGSCAPNDGPALTFKVGVEGPGCDADFPAGGPLLRVHLFRAGPLEPGFYPLDGGNGFATLDAGNGEQESQTGTVSLIEWNGGFPYGEIDITFPDDTHVVRAFQATACELQVPCG